MGFWSFAGKTLSVAASATLVSGKLVAKGAAKAAALAYEHRDPIIKVTTTIAKTAATTAAVTGYGAYKATSWTAGKLYDHRDEIRGAAHGAAVGAAGSVADASGHLIDLQPFSERLKAQSAEYRQRVRALWARLENTPLHMGRRDLLLDTIAVGGGTLADYASGAVAVPLDVERAFELAYPDLATRETFAEAVRDMDAGELEGLSSGVKGKLFEIQYADYLNDGHLPDGYVASLADSATQPGWDIRITGPDGSISELIQAKATDSASYVAEALTRYPHIDVVTTSEVHSQLVMQGLGDHVIDGGISDGALEATVETAAGETAVQMDWLPPSLSLALIAFSSYSKTEMDAYARSRNFGERASKSYLAHLAGGALAIATNTWWLAVVGGVGTRLLVGGGRKKRETFAKLKRLIADNDRVLNRLPKPD